MSNNRLIFIRWSLLLSYIVIFYGSLMLTIRLRYGHFINGSYLKEHIVAFSIIYIVWLFLFYIHNLFEIQTLRSFRTLLLNLSSAMMFCLLAAVTYFYLQPGLILTPRRFLLLHVVLIGLLVLLWQLVIKYILNHSFIEDLYLFSDNQRLEDLIAELKSYDFLGMRFVGLLNSSQIATSSFDRPVSVVIPDTVDVPPEIMRQFYVMRLQNITFYNYQSLYESLTRKIYLDNLNEAWFLTNINYRKKRFYQFIKRLIDVFAGILGLVVFIASYPFVGLLIKLTSSGPVLFKQPRIGKYGTIFTVFKYRTMAGDVHDTWTQPHDPRVTLLGRILRRSRLDELPQCINLLRGNMSLVGPRPEQPHIVEQVRQEIPFYDERHLVKPGLTGWGQLNVYARTLSETKTKLQYDLYYIKHRSLGFDLEIIIKTAYHVLTNNNS